MAYEDGSGYIDGPDEECDEHVEEDVGHANNEYEELTVVQEWLSRPGPDWAHVVDVSRGLSKPELGKLLHRHLEDVCVTGYLSVMSSADVGDKVARAHVVVQDGPEFLKNRHVRIYTMPHRNRARQGDKVWVKILCSEVDSCADEDGEHWDPLRCACIFGTVVRASRRLDRNEYVCRMAQVQWRRDRQIFLPFSPEIPALWAECAAGSEQGDSEDRQLYRLYKLRIVDWPVGSPRPQAEVVHSWEQPRDQASCLESYLEDLGDMWKSALPQPTEAPTDAFSSGRMDLLNRNVFTIDCDGARILDDAFDFNQAEHTVSVHIADVAAIVASNSEVDCAAAERGCALHLRDHSGELRFTSQMLPDGILEAASLSPDGARRAITFEFRVGGGRITEKRFFRSWVRSRAQLSFRQATEALRGGDAGVPVDVPWLRDTIRRLHDVTVALEDARAAGDPGVRLRSTATKVGADDELPAQRIVEFWMSQVNELAGEELGRAGRAGSCGLAFPIPDGAHFSRLAATCRQALLDGAGRDAEGAGALASGLRASAARCRGHLADALSHVMRRRGGSGQGGWGGAAARAGLSRQQREAAGALLPMIYAHTPAPLYWATAPGRAWPEQWPILHGERYFQVTSPLRRWVDLLGQRLLFGCQATLEGLSDKLGHYNEMARLSRKARVEYQMLSLSISLSQAERVFPCVIGSLSSSSVQLMFPAVPEMPRPLTIPLGVLQSECVAVRHDPDAGRATLTRFPGEDSVDLVPFSTAVQVQVGVNQSGPVLLGRLAAVALEVPLPGGPLRHAVLPRQFPEVFGPPPDLRRMPRVGADAAEWTRVWHLARAAQVCAGALVPRERHAGGSPPYFHSMTCDAEAVSWARRGDAETMHATVLGTYRGLAGLVRLREGHLAIAQVRGSQDRRWTGYGRITDVEEREELRRRTQLCEWVLRGQPCRRPPGDCWFAHGDAELAPRRVRVIVELGASSSAAMPRWASRNGARVELELVRVTEHERQSLDDLARRVHGALTRQVPALVQGLLFPRQARAVRQGPRREGDAPPDGPPRGARGGRPPYAEGLPALNDFQERARAMALREPLCYVQGPPGTGKSTTAAHLICSLMEEGPAAWPARAGARLLVCAPSNKACDRLLQLVSGSELPSQKRLVRIYAHSIERMYWPDPTAGEFEQRDFSISPELERFALHNLVQQGHRELYRDFEQVNRDLKGVDGDLKRPQLPSKLRELDDKLQQLKDTKMTAMRELAASADVVFSKEKDGTKINFRAVFAALVIDEAAQAGEADLAVCCLSAEQKIVLFGDHNQLGPVITEVSIFPTFRSLASTSLFERLVGRRRGAGGRDATRAGGQRGVIPHVTLLRQYRMHPSISAFPNGEFYDGKLVDAPETVRRRGHHFSSSPDSRLAVVDNQTPHGSLELTHDAQGQFELDMSLCNEGEAELAGDIIHWLLGRGVQPRDIAVVTPYRAQALLVKNKLLATVGDGPIAVGTVHLLQGEERDYVVLSLVRSHARAEIGIFDPVPARLLHGRRRPPCVGFLADRRMANVALTRARRGLFVLGNVQVLASVGHWQRLFRHARAAGAAYTAAGARAELQRPPSDGPDPDGGSDASGGGARGGGAASGSEDLGDSSSDGSDGQGAESGPDAFADAVPSSEGEGPAPAAAGAAGEGPAPARRPGEAAAAEADEDALLEAAAAAAAAEQPGAPADAAPTRPQAQALCGIDGCQSRVRASGSGAASGLCTAHWKDVVREVNMIQEEVGRLQRERPGLPPGGNAMQFFAGPWYWDMQPPHPHLQMGLRARGFFSAVARSLVSRGHSADATALVAAFSALSAMAFHRRLGLRDFPRAADDRRDEPDAALLFGPLLAALALADAGVRPPPELAPRWELLEAASAPLPRGAAARAAASSGGGGPADFEASFGEDSCAAAAFWKAEGNRALRDGDADAAIAHYRSGRSLVLKVMTPQARQLLADLNNNDAAACLRQDRLEEAVQAASEALSVMPDGSNCAKAKALFRRGCASMMLSPPGHNDHEAAGVDLREALELMPADEGIREKFHEWRVQRDRAAARQ
ncbi:unnamed protein product [Prorocentrum cordatum]|uniref:C3H1-type domain-containing protein n=1 Tax=Prorocentrum cordatum TaxID=2364126 RepID=A0ABN9UVC7_9DINO|nr:unnamed protein product [Polarella glacialis]